MAHRAGISVTSRQLELRPVGGDTFMIIDGTGQGWWSSSAGTTATVPASSTPVIERSRGCPIRPITRASWPWAGDIVRRMRATIKEVARRAGVSPKTVSDVINGTSPVTPPTRARVEEAITALDYVPNLFARGLRNGRTGLIALALPDLSTWYSAEMAHHFVEAAARRGLGVQIEVTGVSGEREQALVSRARAHLIDGVILNPVMLESVPEPTGIALPPMVFIGEVSQSIADHVWIDNFSASQEIVELLIGEGHRRIAALGIMRTETARLRLAGYRKALEEGGLDVDPDLEIANDLWRPEGARAAITEYLYDHPVPDAIYCFTDSMAFGVLSALRSLGHRVPEDVSVVGYDNCADGEFTSPPLTTIDFDKAAYAETALRLLIRRIVEPDRPVEIVTVSHRIQRRDSTRAR